MSRIALLLVAALFTTQALALSPPWYERQRLIAASVGANPLVAVGAVVEVAGGYRVDVTCADPAVARGASFLLRKEYDFGGVRLTVRVLDAAGNVVEVDESSIGGEPMAAARDLFGAALEANPLFDSFSTNFLSELVVLVRPEVVQFWNDDLSSPSGNTSRLAAEAFSSCARETVLSGAVRPGWSTAAVSSAGGRLEGWVPAVARSPGLFGSSWKTDLRVLGREGTIVRFWFHGAGKDNTGAASVALPLTGSVTVVPDVLETLFHAGGHGSLRYVADSPVRVVARTFTDTPEGTSGIFTPDVSLAEAARGGTPAATLVMALDRPEGSRANLGLVNASRLPVTLTVDMTLPDGTPAPGESSFPVSLPPLGMTQENDLLARLSPWERRGLLVRVRVLTPGGAVFAFLTEVDNTSNSPSYQSAVLP